MASESIVSSGLQLHEKEKRWLVVGIALSKVVISTIRPFVKQAIEREYNSLKATHSIHLQNSFDFLRWRQPYILRYENINGNDIHRNRFNYDMRVCSYIDFAKLFVPKHMATFNAFDDNCDASALLLLLDKMPVFSGAVRSAAGGVRTLRHEWMRSVISQWHEDKFVQSFHLMEDLVKAMALPSKDEGKLLQELQDWKDKDITIISKEAEIQQCLGVERSVKNYCTPRSSGHKGRETFYEKGFILDSQEDWETEYMSLENCDSCPLSWKIMEKAKTFICAFLNAAIPGTIYFGVANSEENSSQQNVMYNHGEILGLDVENIKDDIIEAFQFVLDTQISSDQGGLLKKGGDQNCVSIHFVPVKIQGIRSKLYVIEIDVLRDWLLCKDNVFFCKSWIEAPRQEAEEKDSNRKGLSNFFMVKEHWDDVVIRDNGELHHVKPLDVHKCVRQRLREWYNERRPEAQHEVLQRQSLPTATTEAIAGPQGQSAPKKVPEAAITGCDGLIRDCGKCNKRLTKLHTSFKCDNQHVTCRSCVIHYMWSTRSTSGCCPYQDCRRPVSMVSPLDTKTEHVFIFVDTDRWFKVEETTKTPDIGTVIGAVAKGKDVAMTTLYGSEPPQSHTVRAEHNLTVNVNKPTAPHLSTDIVKVVTDAGVKEGKIVIVNADDYMIPAVKIGLENKWSFDIWLRERDMANKLNKLADENPNSVKIFWFQSDVVFSPI